MPDSRNVQTFRATSDAGRRPWAALAAAIPVAVMGLYFLGWVLAGVVALVAAVVVVPLTIRHRRAEATSQVDVTTSSVVYRRGGAVKSQLDRRGAGFETLAFTDRHGLTPQLLLTDGNENIRLVAGQWKPATLDELALAASGRPPTPASWQQIKAGHRPALAFWERHTTAIIAGTVFGIPILIILGAVLAVLLFDVG